MAENDKSDGCIPELSSGTIEFAGQGVPAPASVTTNLIIPAALFEQTMAELMARSDGWRESAAILCGRVEGCDWIAETVRFHHHLCNDQGRPRSMHLTEAAKFQLYEELNKSEQRLIAGIHTHPEDWVDLSWIDRQNQICSRTGFWSIVAPFYGTTPWTIEIMGVHIRLPEGWGRLTKDQIEAHVRIEEPRGSL